MRYRDLRGVLASSVAVMAVAVATPAVAQVRSFDIPAQSAATGIPALAKQADIQLLVSSSAVSGKAIRAVKGRMTVDEAVRRVVGDADLQIVNSDGRTFTLAPREMKRVRSALEAPVAMAAQDARAPAYDEIIVTAQKKEERIQDVPIAMSAFSSEALDDYKIEGGSELLRAIPNMNFSKGNFSTYNIAIRGIGTKAVSASTDPAVAVSFNNTPLIRNRLFESEFFDMQRVEVLRGPQGTLYGRNATGGVVNLIPNLPGFDLSGMIKGEVGSFNSRRASGMLNVPLADNFAVRVAGALTKRDGFDYNTYTNKRVNDRDLWSTRTSVAWEPTESFRVEAVWQHFTEDDNRSRTGKQLCARDPGPTQVGNTIVPDGTGPGAANSTDLRGRLSQGCLPVSLYDPASYGAPNASGYAPIVVGADGYLNMGFIPGTNTSAGQGLISLDPYRDVVQSRNLREISTSIDPVFKANNDVLQFNVSWDVGDRLTFVSQTAYSDDRYFSTQDYNRFVSAPVFVDTTAFVDGPPAQPAQPAVPPFTIPGTPIVVPGRPAVPAIPEPSIVDQTHASPGGVFCDPQLGCSDRMLAADLSKSKNNQFFQEVRLTSDYGGAFNFNFGMNYLKFKSEDNYYVFNNLWTFIAYNRNNKNTSIGTQDMFKYFDCPVDMTENDCIYVDPNPISTLDGNGHNYFRSKNRVKTESYSAFLETYYNLADNIKLTAGLRVTHDKKTAILSPSQLLLGGGTMGTSGGTISGGYPENAPLIQKWTRPTGRLVIDWTPDLDFTDHTLIYGSFSHGYKGGGANPARPAITLVNFLDIGATFKPEYVNAFEVGTKNTLLNGNLTVNLTGFYYDYKNYQISQIVDRIALNENFDTTSMGLEFEAKYSVSRSLRIDTNIGYLKARARDGQHSIDVMNRTQGNPEWTVVRPFLQVPSNCIAPTAYVEKILSTNAPMGTKSNALYALCPQSGFTSFDPRVSTLAFINQFGFTYDPTAPYEPSKVGNLVPYNPADPTAWIGQSSGAPNQSRGFYADLSGNEMPNSPHWTANIGAQYTINLGNFDVTARGDLYHQGKSYARIYNTQYDRLRSWQNVNLSVSIVSSKNNFGVEAYVKNVFNSAPITDTYTNSDDSMLTTNIFTLDPRIFGFSGFYKF